MTCRCNKFQAPSGFQSLSIARETALQTLLRNNVPTRDSVAASTVLSIAKDDLDRCRAALNNFGREQMRIEGIIQSLRNQEKDLEQFHKDATSLTSVIRKLSPEILQHIFKFVDDGVTLARVCKHWERLAYTTKELWCTIHVDGSPNHRYAEGFQLPQLKKLLRLSGPLPLILTYSGVWHASLVNELRAHSNRWHSFTMADYPPLLQNLNFSVLHQLTIPLSLWCSASGLPSTVRHLIVAESLPAPTNVTHTLHANNLQHLESHSLPAWWAQQIMKACPAIVTMTLLHCHTYDSHVRRPHSPFRMPKLTTLIIKDSMTSAIKQFFTGLSLPCLQSLTMDSLVEDDGRQGLFPLAEFVGLTQRPVKLTSLSLSNLVLHPMGLASILRLVPSLEKLVLPSPMSDELVNMMNPTRYTFPAQPMAPKLLHLEVNHQALLFSPRVFVDMVRSRWNPGAMTSNRTCSNLKTLVVRTSRNVFVGENLRSLRVLHHAGMKILLKAGDNLIDLDQEG